MTKSVTFWMTKSMMFEIKKFNVLNDKRSVWTDDFHVIPRNVMTRNLITFFNDL
jgi:hypothetical protein